MIEGTEPIRLTDEQRLDWLRLIRSQNVGPRTFRALINHFGGARAALEALPGLARRGGGNASPQIYSREEAQREIDAARKIGVSFVAIGEADYPRRLQMIDDAPPLIAIRGHAAVLAMPQVAIVGSPLDPRAEGTNGLIKQGATPVTEAADIITVLQPIMGLELPAREPEEEEMEPVMQNIEPAPDERTRIVALLSPAPVSIDDLIRLSQSSPRVVRMVLLELEIAGRLERHGGGLVSLM